MPLHTQRHSTMSLLSALFLTTLLFTSTSPLSARTSRATKASKNIEGIITALDQHATVSLMVQDKKGRMLFAHNPNKYLMPASTLKVPTALLATKVLPEHTPFVTQLQCSSRRKNRSVYGNCVLTGQGDPSFTSEDLEALIQSLRQYSVHTIHGNFVLNNYLFDDRTYTPGTFWEEVRDCYAGPTSALSIDKNCFLIHLDRKGKNAQTLLTNPNPNQPIDLALRSLETCFATKNDASIHHTVYHSGAVLDHDPFYNPQRITGCWAKSHTHEHFKLSTKSPDTHLQAQVKRLLKKYRITLTGDVIIQPLNTPPKNHLLIASHASPELSNILKTMLKESDNHIANHLFKHLYAQTCSPCDRASWEEGENTYRSLLTTMQLDPEKSSIVDGSGLSRNNRISASFLQKTLFTILKNPSYQHLIFYFPHNHGKGPLQKRLGSVTSDIYAKTGYVRGAIALAGVINPFKKNEKIFTLILNGDKDAPEDYKKIEAELFTAIEKL